MKTSKSTHESIWKILKQAPTKLKGLSLAFFTQGLGMFFGAFGILYLNHQGYSNNEITQLLIFFAVGGISGSYLSGFLAANFLPEKIYRNFSPAQPLIVSTMLLLPEKSFPIISMQLFLLGYVSATLFTVCFTIFAISSDSKNRVPHFALLQVAMHASGLISAPVMGWLAKTDFKLLLLFSLICLTIFTVITWVTLTPVIVAENKKAQLPQLDSEYEHQTLNSAKNSSVNSSVSKVTFKNFTLTKIQDLKSYKSNASLNSKPILLCLIIAIISIIAIQYNSSLSLQLKNNGIDAVLYSNLLLINSITGVILTIPISSVTRKFSWKLSIGFGALLLAVGLQIASSNKTILMMAVGMVVFTLGEVIVTPVENAAVAAISRKNQMAKNQAFLDTCVAVANLIGPAVGVFLLSALGINFWFLLTVIGFTLSTLFAVSYIRAALLLKQK